MLGKYQVLRCAGHSTGYQLHGLINGRSMRPGVAVGSIVSSVLALDTVVASAADNSDCYFC